MIVVLDNEDGTVMEGRYVLDGDTKHVVYLTGMDVEYVEIFQKKKHVMMMHVQKLVEGIIVSVIMIQL